MPRVFLFQELEIDDHVSISGDDAHHIIRVLRCRPGDEIKISNGKNTESIGIIEDMNIKSLEIKLRILEKNTVKDIRPMITLLQGVPKGEKFNWILQKNTEIGVCKFIPVVTQRTVVALSPSKFERRRERWGKIVREAAKQCMRMDIPEIGQLTTFDLSLKEVKNHQITIIPWEQEKETSLKKVLKNLDKTISRIAVYIGPEGGFSKDEVEKAKKAGAVPVSLGPRILRTETAGMVVCSAIMYELGSLGG